MCTGVGLSEGDPLDAPGIKACAERIDAKTAVLIENVSDHVEEENLARIPGPPAQWPGQIPFELPRFPDTLTMSLLPGRGSEELVLGCGCRIRTHGCLPVEGGVAHAALMEGLVVLEDCVRELDAGVPVLPVQQFGRHPAAR
jgi:hypothetical protein